MDEVGRGTSTLDGLSLARAIAQYLIDVIGCFTLFSTHYFELTQLPDLYPTAKNMHFSAIDRRDEIIFLYKIQPGPASQSYGLQVAKLAGLPNIVIASSRKHLKILGSQLSFLTSKKEGNTKCYDEETSTGEKLAASLEKINPDLLTPREALEKLYQLKRLSNCVERS
jgi:DNA mismatch repair protein MutS